MSPVVVFGATGFTGRLVVAELAAREIGDLILGGRSEDRLRDLSEQHGGLPYRVADAADPARLAALVRGAKIVVITAGPFVHVAEPVVAAALDAGAHVLDTSGEQRYMETVLRRHDERAREKKLAVINALGFDFALGCAGAALLAGDDPSLDTIDVFNRVRPFLLSRGSWESTFAGFLGGGLIFDRGRLEEIHNTGIPRVVHLPGSPLPELCVALPAAEALHLPRSHPLLRNVTTSLVIPAAFALAVESIFALPPSMQRLAHRSLLDSFERSMTWMPEGPAERARRRQEGLVFVRGSHLGDRRRRHPEERDARRGLSIRCFDPYGLTAELVAFGAARLLEGPPHSFGVLGPHQAFGAQEILDAARVETSFHSI